MQPLVAPRRMKSVPLGRHALYKEEKRDVSQRTFYSESTNPG
jgi:hypothetical protein